MLKRGNIKPIILIPLALPAMVAYKGLSATARQKVLKDVLMFWNHTIGPTYKSTWNMWWKLISCNKEFRNVFYCRVPNFWRIVLPWFLKPYPSLSINPTLSKNYEGGLYIAHGASCRIAPRKIGENAWIHQNVTIGMKGEYRPEIGDNVYIGCGAVIIGKTKIGNNVRIGANSVIVDDNIPDNATVCGPKATIVRVKN